MIEIDGEKYAENAYERDILGLPPSPALHRKAKTSAKGGRKSRWGRGYSEEPSDVPQEDRGPHWEPEKDRRVTETD